MDRDLNNLITLSLLCLLLGLVLGKRKKLEITNESNCDDLLKDFNKQISLHHEKVQKLKRAHATIRSKVRDFIKFHTNLPLPEFYIQGSYKMKTIVENRITRCDIDLAVIFPTNPGVKLETLQNHLRRALWNHTAKGVVVKSTCVRLTFIRDFHIDLPIYFRDTNSGKLYFGSRGEPWELSDPKNFFKWFRNKTANKPQLVTSAI